MRCHLHKRRRSLGWYHSWSRYSFMYSWIEACCLIYPWCGLILTFSCRNESFSSAIPFSELLQVLFRMFCLSSKLYWFVDVWVWLFESCCWNSAVICGAVFLSDNFFMAFPDIITTDDAGSVQEWIWWFRLFWSNSCSRYHSLVLSNRSLLLNTYCDLMVFYC